MLGVDLYLCINYVMFCAVGGRSRRTARPPSRDQLCNVLCCGGAVAQICATAPGAVAQLRSRRPARPRPRDQLCNVLCCGGAVAQMCIFIHIYSYIIIYIHILYIHMIYVYIIYTYYK